MLKVQEMIEANTALVLENKELKQRLKKTTKKLSMYGTERKQLKQENGHLLLELGFDPEEKDIFYTPEEQIAEMSKAMAKLQKEKAFLKQLNRGLQNRCQEYIEMLGGDQIPHEDAV